MIRTLIIIIFGAVLFTGCVLSSGLKKYELRNADMDLITEALKNNYQNIKLISGDFDFSYSTESDRKQSSGYIYLSNPDTLYLIINGLVGETEAVMFIDKDSVKAVNYFEKLSISDKSNENSIRRLTGMNLTCSDFRNGFMSYNKNMKPLKIAKRTENSIVIRSEISNTRYQFITINENMLISEINEYEERELLFKKKYDYFIEKDGHVVPKRIRIRTFNPPTKLTVFYNSIQVNKFKDLNIKVSL